MPTDQERPGMYAPPDGSESRGYCDSRNLQEYSQDEEELRHPYAHDMRAEAEAAAHDARRENTQSTNIQRGRSPRPSSPRSSRKTSGTTHPPEHPHETATRPPSHSQAPQRTQAMRVSRARSQDAPRVRLQAPEHAQSKPQQLHPQKAVSDFPARRAGNHLEEQRKALQQAHPHLLPQVPSQIPHRQLANGPAAPAPQHIRALGRGSDTPTSQNNTELLHALRMVTPANVGSTTHVVQSRPPGPPRLATLDTGDSFHTLLGVSPPEMSHPNSRTVTTPARLARPEPPPRIPTLDVDSGESLHAAVSEYLTADCTDIQTYARDMPTSAAIVKGGVKSFLGSQKRR